MVLDSGLRGRNRYATGPVGDGPTALGTLQYGFLIRFHLLPIPSKLSPLLLSPLPL